jgi:hypothetical protein
MQTLSDLVRQVIIEKQKYAQKVASESAVQQNVFDIYIYSDQIGFQFDQVILDSVFTSLVGIAFFGLDPSEIPVYNLCFDTSLPSAEEFAQGKLINVQNVSCLEKYPEMTTYISEAVNALKPSTIQKCYWGKSTYEDCYVDPSVIRDYLRSTMLRVFKVPRTGGTQKSIHDSFIANLDMLPEPLKAGWEMSNYIFEAKYRDAWWDYAIWDLSMWAEEETYIVNYENKPVTANPEHPMDVMVVAFWDLGVWDFSFWAEETHSTPEGREMLDRFAKLYESAMAIADMISFEAKSRLLTTPLIVANYQTREERENWTISKRVDDFGYTKVWVYMIRDIVRSIVKNAPPGIFRVYESAAMSLVSRIGRPGGWGYDAFRSMDINTFKRQWIDEWSRKGLDPNILEAIFDRVISEVKVFSSERFKRKVLQQTLYGGIF